MKIILLKQFPELGNAGDVLEVSPGYARNFLIKKGIAREATTQLVTVAHAQRVAKKNRAFKKETLKQKVASVLEGVVIPIKVKANDDGVLFGGVGPVEIAKAITEKKRIEINVKQVHAPHHLKTLGKHRVVLHLGGGTETACTIDLIREH